ncbi:EamA family transporter, partial [bacterium]|nr:EamA family transporter [bacterium]
VNTSMFVAIFFGALILKERITIKHLISAIIAFLGVFLVIRG